MRNIIPIIFYGNIFYGLCAVALCLETNLQHHIPANGPHFYFLVFAVTVVYYTRIYFTSSTIASSNKRIAWYVKYRSAIKLALQVAAVLIVADSIVVVFKYLKIATTLHLVQWGLMIIFPVIALLYTFEMLPFKNSRQLRSIGWLKPFFIGFSWAGLVTVYPVFFRQMQSGISTQQFILPSGLFWLQNFLYISALAIMFDIKDFIADIRFHLNTYPALMGIRKSILYLIIPTTIASYIALLFFLRQQQHPPMHFVLQTIPYLLLLLVTTTLKRRGILFYLVVIDGLMLLKAACGIASMVFF